MQRIFSKLYANNVRVYVPHETKIRKCMGCPEGKSVFKNKSKQAPGYWENQENIIKFLSELKEKYNINTPEDWNSITKKHILSNGGRTLLNKYSIYEIKCMACPEGNLIFNNPKQPSGYWENQENILQFLSKIKEKYNLNTPDDWNSITLKHIQSNGGATLVNKYSLFKLKCMACPEGKSMFIKSRETNLSGYWGKKDNILQFLSKIREKYNLNTPEDWNSITRSQIKSNRGGSSLLSKYSMYELKCMACPEGNLIFNNPKQPSGYWENEDNILQFLSKIKEKYNLNTSEDWNSITHKLIRSNGGSSLLHKYSIYELKCMACPEGKSMFNDPKETKPSGYWKKHENILQFFSEIKEKYNLNTPEDWNSITHKLIQSNGGNTLLGKYSIYQLKCMACPEGKLIFTNSPQPSGYWENQDNITKFLYEIKEKYNLNTPEDWNSITRKHITSNRGASLLHKHSIYELKCMACPEGKSIFTNPPHPSGYWENQENILQFLSKIKEKYNLSTPEDWNSITQQVIHSNGGSMLLSKYSMYEIKCMACPEGKSIFTKAPQSPAYWENNENIHNFFAKIKEKYNLNTPEDWKRISRHQIIAEGGQGLFYCKNYSKIKIQFENLNKTTTFILFSKLISGSFNKRSSQRWLFLQVQKLFPHEEIVEDYFHSEISRISGANVQFDIFMIQRNIAIEYHGKHHYEDIPFGFANLETYKYRDLEKEKICKQHGIHLIVIPYWWDNKLDSLKTFLYSKINM